MIVSGVDCGFYRFAGFLLICISLMSITINVRYFIHRCRRRRQLTGKHLSSDLIGMLISSTILMITAIPSTLIQCFTCRPFQPHVFFCKMNGFICFFTGTFNMYVLALLSLGRYLRTRHKQSLLNRLLEHNRVLNVFFCALISLCWTLPPLFSIGNTYTSEGLGFHCSLDWSNSAFHSRLFILSLLAWNYFFVLCFLIYTNLRVYFLLRALLQEHNYFNGLSSPTIFYSSRDNTTPSACLKDSFVLRKYQSDVDLRRRVSRLQLLKIDQHYAQITAIMVTQFIITWTPYAFVALSTVDGRIEFICQNQILSSVCALLAKISIILNPFILIHTSKMREHSMKHL